MKRVLFLNGPSQDPSDRFYGWPTPLLYAIAPTAEAMRNGALHLEMLPPIFEVPWYIEGENDVGIHDAFHERIASADIICASVIYDSLYPTLRLLADAKRLRPEMITILGGPHVDEAHNIPGLNDLTNNPGVVDFLIAGDGEIVLRELLSDIASGTTPNLERIAKRSEGRAWIYGRDGRATTRQRSLRLDDLPYFPIDLAPKQHRQDFAVFSDASGEGVVATAQMMTMRGCPYECNFCSERRDLAYPNAHSIDHILGEIELRKREGFGAVFFDDSTFGVHPRFSDLIQELGKAGMQFGALTRFNIANRPELLESLRDAGFTYLYCAVEQFEDEALRAMQKGQKTATIEAGMRRLQEHGFRMSISPLRLALRDRCVRASNARLCCTLGQRGCDHSRE